MISTFSYKSNTFLTSSYIVLFITIRKANVSNRSVKKLILLIIKKKIQGFIPWIILFVLLNYLNHNTYLHSIFYYFFFSITILLSINLIVTFLSSSVIPNDFTQDVGIVTLFVIALPLAVPPLFANCIFAFL